MGLCTRVEATLNLIDKSMRVGLGAGQSVVVPEPCDALPHSAKLPGSKLQILQMSASSNFELLTSNHQLQISSPNIHFPATTNPPTLAIRRTSHPLSTGPCFSIPRSSNSRR